MSLDAVRLSGANRQLRLVQLARLASVTGRWAFSIALAVYAYERGGASAVAVAGLVRLLPGAFAAPFVGVLAHRVPVHLVLLVGGMIRAGAFAAAGIAVLGHASVGLVYVLVALESAVSTFLRPVQNSLLPELARTPQELTSTNLVMSVIESLGVLGGPLLGAALLKGTSVGIVFLASALAYGVSAALLAPLRVGASEEIAGGPRHGSVVSDALAGVRAIAADGETRLVVLLYGAQNLVAGALNVLVVVAALRLLSMGQTGVGTLTAAIGVGGVVGGALVFARLRLRRHGADMTFGLLLWGLPLVLLAWTSSPAVALVLLGLVGVGVTTVDVAAITLIQRSAAGERLPHALGMLQSVFVLGVAGGTLLAPLLLSFLGIRGALVAVGAFLPMLAAGLWTRLRRLDSEEPGDQETVALLIDCPIFAPLPVPLVESLARTVSHVSLPAGTTVFAQGDPGDAFYLVESGAVDVVVDGVPTRTLERGGTFGEIALLRAIPRTASIVTRTETRLARLEREPFLGAVTGNSSSADAANNVVIARLGSGRRLTAGV